MDDGRNLARIGIGQELAGLIGRHRHDLHAAATCLLEQLGVSGSWPDAPVPTMSRFADHGMDSSADRGVWPNCAR